MTDGADPLVSLAAVWASIGERTQDYVEVWRSAIERNADDDYAARDLLEDVEALWGMTIGDVARFSAAIVDAAGPLLAGFVDDGPKADADPTDGSA